MSFLLTKITQALKPAHSIRLISTTVVNPAKRKGYREAARKKKVKTEIIKVGFIPHNQREDKKLNFKRPNKHVDYSKRKDPIDNVYFSFYFKSPVYSIADAVKAHRETHHPTQFNKPDAPLIARIELFMKSEKKTKMVDDFTRIAFIPHAFDQGEARSVLFLGKTQEVQQEALNAGASLVGGPELIKSIQNGEIDHKEYQFVLAHPNILADIAVLRGLLRKKFPMPKAGTMDMDVTGMVTRFLKGVEYKAVKDEYQPDFGLIEVPIGTLDMDTQQLEENIVSLLNDINSVRPKREGRFITRLKLKSPPSTEQLHVNPFVYIPEIIETVDKKSASAAEEEDSDDEAEKPEKEAVVS